MKSKLISNIVRNRGGHRDLGVFVYEPYSSVLYVFFECLVLLNKHNLTVLEKNKYV